MGVTTQVLKFKRIDEEIRARELKPALELLCHAGLLQRIFATTATGLPLHAHMKEDRYKLLYLDVGLLQTAVKVDATHFFDTDILQINAGMIAEHLYKDIMVTKLVMWFDVWGCRDGGGQERDESDSRSMHFILLIWNQW